MKYDGKNEEKRRKVKENWYWEIQHLLSRIGFRKEKMETVGRKRGAIR